MEFWIHSYCQPLLELRQRQLQTWEERLNLTKLKWPKAMKRPWVKQKHTSAGQKMGPENQHSNGKKWRRFSQGKHDYRESRSPAGLRRGYSD